MFFERKNFISDKFNFLSMGIGLLINIIHWAILLIKIQPTNQSILLHYNVVYGPDLVDKSSFVYLIPLIALAFMVVNIGLAIFYFSREKMASRFLVASNIAVQLVFITASFVLILANN